MPSRHLPALRAQPTLLELLAAHKLLARALGVNGVEHIWPPSSLEEFDPDLSLTSAQGSSQNGQGQPEDADAAFELRHARTWLTLLIKSGLSWLPDESDAEGEEIAAVLDRTAELLSICAGKSGEHRTDAHLVEATQLTRPTASGPSTRIYHFRLGADSDVKVSIRDGTLTADALGSRTWGSAPLLSQRLIKPLCEALDDSAALAPLRILELGAGTGLVGLALAEAARYLHSQVAGLRHVEIALTDYHPAVLANLQHNAALNAWPAEEDGAVRVKRLDWEAVHQEMQGAVDESHVQTSEQQVAREALGQWPELSEEGYKRWDTLVAAGEQSANSWL